MGVIFFPSLHLSRVFFPAALLQDKSRKDLTGQCVRMKG